MKAVIDDKIPYIRGLIETLVEEVIYKAGSDICATDVRDADILIVRTRTRCDRNLLSGSRVRLVVTATIGFDHIDTEYMEEAGIRWTGGGGYPLDELSRVQRFICETVCPQFTRGHWVVA